MRRFLFVAVALLLAVAPAYAGMIQTPVDDERSRVKALLEREEVRVELEKHGVLAHEAAARVDAMTPAEVQQLAGRIDALAAGGQRTQDLLLIIIIILLIIIII
jgi:hypothetical protein